MTQLNPMEHHEQGTGARFTRARVEKGLGVDDVAAALRVPTRVIHAIEADQAQTLGANIFVRGHLTAYARLLGLPASIANEACAPEAEAPPLVTMAPSTRLQRLTESVARRAVYIVLTATIVVPAIWIATDRSAPERLSLSPLDPTPVRVQTPGREDVPTLPASVAAQQGPTVVASLTPFYQKPGTSAAESEQGDASDAAPSAARGDAWLTLEFRGESWVEVFDGNGQRIEQALLPAGTVRHYAEGQVSRITLGNAGAVDVKRSGDAVDISRFMRANVARFTVSSDGSMAVAGG